MNPILKEVGVRGGAALMAYLMGRGVESGEANLIRGLRGADKFHRKNAGMGPVLSALYAAATPKGFVKHPFRHSGAVLFPSAMSGMAHGFFGEDPSRLQEKARQISDTSKKMLTPEGRHELGGDMFDQFKGNVSQTIDKNTPLIQNTLKGMFGRLSAGTVGSLAGGGLMAALLALLDDDKLPEERAMQVPTAADLDDRMNERQAQETRNNILKILGALAGGVGGAYLYGKHMEKTSQAFGPWKQRALMGALAYLMHPYVENVAAGGSRNMSGGAFSRDRFIPRTSGRHPWVNAATSPGGTRIMSALMAMGLGKKVGTLPGVSMVAAPAIASGVSHKIWPGEGLSRGLELSDDMSGTLGAMAGGDSVRMGQDVAMGFQNEAKQYLKNDVLPIVSDPIKRYGLILAAAMGGGLLGNYAGGKVPVKRLPNRKLDSVRDVDQFLEDREDREMSRDLWKSLGTLGGATTAGGLMALALAMKNKQ
jgi:hypothetical protein